ncbi:hypothetical protein RKD29_007442 [Streptomyces tendae]
MHSGLCAMARIGCYQVWGNGYGGLDPSVGEWAKKWESTAGRPRAVGG